MIEALSCPRCYSDGYRALGAHARGLRVACRLCGTIYVQPSAERLRAHADQRWRQNDDEEPPKLRSVPSYSSLEEPPRSLWSRVWALLRAAWKRLRGRS